MKKANCIINELIFVHQFMSNKLRTKKECFQKRNKMYFKKSLWKEATIT